MAWPLGKTQPALFALMIKLLKKPSVYFLLVVIAFVIIPVATFYGFSLKPDVTLLALTGIAVTAYTIETYKMRLELVRQNEISIMPFLGGYF